MLQNKGKYYSDMASAFRELAAEDEEVLASVLIGFTYWLLTTKRLACLNMAQTKIKTSYFFGEIQRYRFVVDKLAQEQFWITANGEPEKKLGTIGEIGPQFIELFNSTLGVAESPKTPSPERIEASVDTAVTESNTTPQKDEKALSAEKKDQRAKDKQSKKEDREREKAAEKEDREREKAAEKEDREREKAAEKEAKTAATNALIAKQRAKTREQARIQKEKAAEELRRCGRQIYQGFIGLQQVTFYENGYVKVSLIGLKGVSDFEKLLAIDGDIDNVVKKTGLGRGAGAVLTLGLNTLTPNKRGDIYLTIVTDKTVHTLHTDFAASTNIKEVKRMEQVGKGLIAKSKVAPAVPQESGLPSQATGLVADLEALKRMVDSGVLSQQEFDAAKRKLLESS